jgi:MFS family permease
VSYLLDGQPIIGVIIFILGEEETQLINFLLGRKRTIQFASIFALLAGIIQTTSINVGMLIAGRIIGGFAVGIMSMYRIVFGVLATLLIHIDMTIPIYNSEIAPPAKRGMIAGLHAQFVGIG